jgi:prepilin-type N-terminal cleavage/methylation domain-containing protein
MMTRRRSQAGLTLLEIMIAVSILVVMMTLGWKTIASTSDTRRTFTAFEERNHELRMALARVASDFEAAYLSKNEDTTSDHPRTMMIGKSTGKVPDVRFSTLNHHTLWADANESEQTVIQYLAHPDPENSSITDWIRREQRRESNQPPEEEPADYDVLVHDIQTVKIEYWNWKNNDWQDSWDTTQADGQKGTLPSRVRITLTVKDESGHETKMSTQARILMQEPLNFTN